MTNAERFDARLPVLCLVYLILQNLIPDIFALFCYTIRNELYHRLFNQLQTHFSALFMPKATMAEDVHVWRFLAAMAVGATVDQQHVLVTEVR